MRLIRNHEIVPNDNFKDELKTKKRLFIAKP